MPKRVQVVFAGLDGALPAGQKLPLMGRTLMSTAAVTGGRVEKAVPINVQNVQALLVLGDLENPGRLANLAYEAGVRLMDMGAGDEMVVQTRQLEAAGLTGALDIVPEDGPRFVAVDAGLYDIFAVKS